MLKKEKIIIKEENNYFGILEKVNIISNFLINNYDSEILNTNNMIALYGEWGSGKSSLLETLKDKVDSYKNNQYKVLFFDTCKYENTDNLAYTLLEFIVSSLSSDKKKKFLENSRDVIVGTAKSLNVSIGIHGITNIGMNFKEIFDELAKREAKRDTFFNKIQKFEKEFKEKIGMFINDNYKFKVCAQFPHLGYTSTAYFNLGEVNISKISYVKETEKGKFNHEIEFELKDKFPIELLQY